MTKKIIILCVFIISSFGIINAQDWSKEDSIWLINVLEGKYDYKINENTKKAIEDGRLTLPSWMKNDEGKINDIEIIKDFDKVGELDSERVQRVDPFSLPPAVFSLYVLYMEKMDSIFFSRSLIITDREKEMLTSLLPTGTIQAFSLTYYMYNSNSNNRNIVTFANRGFEEMLFQSAVGPRFGVTTDFNHLLSMIFSPSYRQKAYNRKHATAYKGYYDEGAVRAVNMTEREREQIRQSLLNIKPKISVGRTSEFRRNGIDD